MPIPAIDLTLIGGPTVLIEVAGARLLTDPTFDPPGDHPGKVLLRKTGGPAVAPEAVGAVDAVLLSHDQHADNLDQSGRAYALKTRVALTTPAGAARLGGPAIGLEPWTSRTITTSAGLQFTITATPARHGPPGAEKLLGDVAGFVVRGPDQSDLVYVTGDTVFYEGVAEVARRFHPKVVLVFAGAAKTRGPFNLTMGSNDLLELAQAFPEAQIVAVHNTDWAHYTEGPADVASVAKTFSLAARLTTLEPGRKTRVWPAP
jgi:L-ascorbate metabolism protein UlaG (beta-lactamase superfamily)